MEFLLDLLSNKVLISTAVGFFIAQCTKNLLLVFTGKFTPDRLTGGGGMPSAHSATVTSLATSTLIVAGPDSPAFTVALFLAIIVIYDAMGVRYETGRQAAALNKLREQQIREGKNPLYDKPMQESMGHTLPEIIAGCAVGITCGIVVPLIMSHFFNV